MLSGAYNNNVQVFQTPGYVVLLNERIHDTRIIPLDGRPHLPRHVRSWLGDSRGHWEGDTLVVETTNLNENSGFRGSSSAVRVVERFTRISPDTLSYEFTLDDPQTWTAPWTAVVPMTKTEDPMFEYACHEGNYSMEGILGGARAQERTNESTISGGGR